MTACFKRILTELKKITRCLRHAPPFIEEGRSASASNDCRNPLELVGCTSASCPRSIVSKLRDFRGPTKLGKNEGKKGSNWVKIVKKVLLRRSFNIVQKTRWKYDVLKLIMVVFRSLIKSRFWSLAWIPWNLSFRYILFHEKKKTPNDAVTQ